MCDVYKSPLNYTGAKDKLISTLEGYFPDNVDGSILFISSYTTNYLKTQEIIIKNF